MKLSGAGAMERHGTPWNAMERDAGVMRGCCFWRRILRILGDEVENKLINHQSEQKIENHAEFARFRKTKCVECRVLFFFLGNVLFHVQDLENNP